MPEAYTRQEVIPVDGMRRLYPTMEKDFDVMGIPSPQIVYDRPDEAPIQLDTVAIIGALTAGITRLPMAFTDSEPIPEDLDISKRKELLSLVVDPLSIAYHGFRARIAEHKEHKGIKLLDESQDLLGKKITVALASSNTETSTVEPTAEQAKKIRHAEMAARHASSRLSAKRAPVMVKAYGTSRNMSAWRHPVTVMKHHKITKDVSNGNISQDEGDLRRIKMRHEIADGRKLPRIGEISAKTNHSRRMGKLAKITEAQPTNIDNRHEVGSDIDKLVKTIEVVAGKTQAHQDRAASHRTDQIRHKNWHRAVKSQTHGRKSDLFQEQLNTEKLTIQNIKDGRDLVGQETDRYMGSKLLTAIDRRSYSQFMLNRHDGILQSIENGQNPQYARRQHAAKFMSTVLKTATVILGSPMVMLRENAADMHVENLKIKASGLSMEAAIADKSAGISLPSSDRKREKSDNIRTKITGLEQKIAHRRRFIKTT